MKKMPLARKIYWNLSLVSVFLLWGGQVRRHRAHEKHDSRCTCFANCIACAAAAILGRE